MVDRLNSFGAEVTRLSREVGVDGKLRGRGGRGRRGAWPCAGWKELWTDNVNLMAREVGTEGNLGGHRSGA